MIVVVDSGGANLASILGALARLGVEACVSSARQEIEAATHVILPGVGSAGKVMVRLQELQLVETLKTLTQPVLGICVGMQVLFDASEEEGAVCLGVMEGRVSQLPSEPSRTLPHMGWNTLEATQSSNLMAGIASNAYVYFVHSFAVPVSGYTCAVTCYGKPFSAAVQHKNFFGVQFHPERSAVVGHQILKNFLEL